MKDYEEKEEKARDMRCLSADGVSMAVSVKGRILGIPMQAEIVRLADGNTLSGKISLTEEMLLDIMGYLSTDWEMNFYDSPLYPLVEGLRCEGALVLDSRESLVLVVQSTTTAVGMIKEGNGLLFLLASPGTEREDMRSDAFMSAFVAADRTALNIRFLECAFLLGANPVLCLRGSLSFLIEDAEYV